MSMRTASCVAAGLLIAFRAFAAEPGQERAELRKMCDEALAMLEKANPPARASITKAAGYGCFSNFGLAFLFGGAGGHGLVHDNSTGRDTYMNQAQVQAGVQVGVKDYREILVFHDHKVMQQFVNSGWELTGGGGATAKIQGKGRDFQEAGAARDGIELFPITRTGFDFGGSMAGRKYWRDTALN